MANPRLIQSIFQCYFSRLDDHPLPLKDRKAAEAIRLCRTPEHGYHYYQCPDDHEAYIQSHSCKHRSCPLCADKARHQWIETQKQRLLDCPHYHVIFTLPHEYLPYWRYNQKWFTQALFKACRDTLMTLLADSRYLGARPGLLMTLHTWGRQLNLHPHIHCLVTAGGLTADQEWKPTRTDYLLPIQVVKGLYRGKLQALIQAAIESTDIRLPPDHCLSDLKRCYYKTYQKAWSVRIQEQYEHGMGVVLYLARYLKGGPIKPSQLVVGHRGITFFYKDHRDKRVKSRRFTWEAFMQRLLWHVPEMGIHVVRHYGIYASSKKASLKRCQDMVGCISDVKPDITTGNHEENALNLTCKHCGKALQLLYIRHKQRMNENSYKEKRLSINRNIVQQGVDTDIANVPFIRGPDPIVA